LLRAHVDGCADCCIALARLMASTQDGGAAGTVGMGEPEEPSAAPGEIIAERYEIGPTIGVGAMGIVAAATDRRLGREVAIKLIRPRGREAAERSTQRLVAESRAMARLRHPNVVAVFDAGPHEGGAYVAMEYVRGQTLRGWLATPRPYPQVLAAFVQAGRGLEAAHREGLVHRDFKPDNVLVDEDGRVQVTDFGLCRVEAEPEPEAGASGLDAPAGADDEPTVEGGLTLAASLTETGGLVGTPAYMAPEQHDGRDVDARADVYAFCVALWEGLTGQRPFSGTTLGQLRAAKLRGPGPMPSDAGLPRWLQRAVCRGLHPDPTQRPASMSELLRALAVPKGRRRRWWIAAFAGTVGLGVGALAFGPLGRATADPACEDDPMRRTWTVATRFAVEMRLGDAAAATRLRLSDYARDWSAAWADTCGEDAGGELVVAERRACLVGQLRRFNRSLEGFIDESLDVRALVASLPAVTACEEGRVAMGAALPAEPATRSAVIDLRDRIGRAQLRQSLGEYAEVGPEIEAIVAEARELDFAPLLAEALVMRGEQASIMREPDARAQLRDAIAVATAAGNDALAIDAWITVARESAAAHGDFDSALAEIRLARAVLDANPGLPGAASLRARLSYERGVLLLEAGDYASAEVSLGSARQGLTLDDIELATDIDEALALIYQSTARLDAADQLHRKVLEDRQAMFGDTDPLLVMTRLNLAAVAAQRGLYLDALGQLELAAPLLSQDSPERQDLLMQRAEVLRLLGRPKESLDAVLAARALGTTPAVAIELDLAESVALADLGRVDDAVVAARRAVREAARQREGAEQILYAQIALTDALLQSGALDEALATVDEALAKEVQDPVLATVLAHLRGRVLTQSGRHDEAIAVLEACLKTYAELDDGRGLPGDAQAFLARSLWAVGRQDQARRVANEALDRLAAHPSRAGVRRDLKAWLEARP